MACAQERAGGAPERPAAISTRRSSPASRAPGPRGPPAPKAACRPSTSCRACRRRRRGRRERGAVAARRSGRSGGRWPRTPRCCPLTPPSPGASAVPEMVEARQSATLLNKPRCLPRPGHTCPKFGRTPEEICSKPKLADVGRSVPKFCSAEIGQTLVDSGPDLAETGPTLIDLKWPQLINAGRFWANFLTLDRMSVYRMSIMQGPHEVDEMGGIAQNVSTA